MNPRLALAFTLALAASLPAGAQRYLPSDQPRSMALRHLDMGRTFEASSFNQVNAAAKVLKPKIIAKSEWGGGESSGTMNRHFPAKLTLHHGGTEFKPGKSPVEHLVNLQKWGWKEKGWADIPYHYMLDLEGKIYECRDVMSVGDTNTTYNPSGHLLVCVMGNYEVQQINQQQLAAISDLMAWGADYFNIAPESLSGHMDYAKTACPGKLLQPYVASGFLEGEIRKRIRKAYLGTESEDEATTK